MGKSKFSVTLGGSDVHFCVGNRIERQEMSHIEHGKAYTTKRTLSSSPELSLKVVCFSPERHNMRINPCSLSSWLL